MKNDVPRPKVDFNKELPPPVVGGKNPMPFVDVAPKNNWLAGAVRLRKPRGGFSGE